MALTLVGLVAGLVGAFALARLMAGLLYGISPGDPATYILVALLLAVVALARLPRPRAARDEGRPDGGSQVRVMGDG